MAMAHCTTNQPAKWSCFFGFKKDAQKLSHTPTLIHDAGQSHASDHWNSDGTMCRLRPGGEMKVGRLGKQTHGTV